MALSNCEVEESSFSPDLEMLVRKSTDMQRLPLTFDVDPTTLEEGKEPFISLYLLNDLSNFQQVSVKIKVLSVSDVEVSTQDAGVFYSRFYSHV